MMKNLENGKNLTRLKEEETLKNIYIYQNRFNVIMKNLNNVTDGYCKIIEAKSVKTNELEIVNNLNSLHVCEESRFDVSRLDAITKWLKENRA